VNIVIVDRMIDMGVEGVEVRDGVDVAWHLIRVGVEVVVVVEIGVE
jgi:hypothetical protein